MEGGAAKKSYKLTHKETEMCLVCTAPATVHSHYGAVTCYPCRAFFRRGISRAYACISGHNKCTVNNITRSNCKRCRFERCLEVGMRPELVDSTSKRKGRERQSKDNTENLTGTDHESVEENIQPASPSTSFVMQSEELLNEIDNPFVIDSETISSQQHPQTFYIFDPRKNTYEPIVIIQSEGNKIQEVGTTEVRESRELDHGQSFVAAKVSVIKSHGVKNDDEISKLDAEEHTDNIKEHYVDIEEIVDICFSEETQNNDHIICVHQKEKRERKTSKSVLPFKKRRRVHQFEFLSTALSKDQTLVPAFTFEEEFRLHDLIVRRDSMNNEAIKHMFQKSPLIMKASFEKTAEAMYKKKKIFVSENQFEFTMECWREFVSSTCRGVYEEFNNLDEKTAFRCSYLSLPAAWCLLMGVNDCNKHLSLQQQMNFCGNSGEIFNKLWEQYFPNMKVQKGLALEDYSMFTSPWARTFEDEQFFTDTTSTVGQLLGSDVKLCVVYSMLLMSSQPEDSPLAGNTQLRQLQLDLGMLLYRYLTTIYGRDEAAMQAHSLIGLLDKLHKCGDIVMKRRIRMLPEEM